MSVFQTLVRWLGETSGPSRTSRRRPLPGRLRPGLEFLEDRALPSGLFGTNLIVDGNAETGPGVTNTQDVIPPPAPWTTALGSPTVAQYGAPDLLGASEGPPDAGTNYFSGGHPSGDSGETGIEQIIDVSSAAATIDAGGVTFTLSGWLGGVDPAHDAAFLGVECLDGSGVNHGGSEVTVHIGDPDYTKAGLVYRQSTQANDAVPAGTRTLKVYLTLEATAFYPDSAGGDDLSLVLNQGSQGAGPAITSAAGTSFTAGSAGSFTVMATGSPTPSLTEAGALPGGVTFTDNGDGTATLAGTPDPGSEGDHPLVITAHNGVGADATQTFTLTVSGTDARLTAAGTPAIENGVENGTPEQANNSTVTVQFTDGDPHAMVSQFTGVSTIDWGDHTTPTPVNLGDIQLLSSASTSTTWQIDGAHTYTEGGQYPITIHVVDREGSTLDIPAGTATVPDAPLLVSSQVVSVQADSSGNPLTEAGAPFSGELLTFSDADSGATPPGPGDYTVAIDWGDGKTETVVPTQPDGPGTEFHVAGTHPFAKAGDLTIHVTITDDKDQSPTKQSATADIPATVADAPVKVTAPPGSTPLQATVGQAFAGVVAAISGDPDANPADFSGTVTWGPGGGDPTPFGPGDVTPATTPGQFLIHVSNTHTFPSAGTFTATVQLTEQDQGSHFTPVTVNGVGGTVTVVPPGGAGTVDKLIQQAKQDISLGTKLKLGLDVLLHPKGHHHNAPPRKRVKNQAQGILSSAQQLLNDVNAIANAAGGDSGVQALVQNFEGIFSGIQAEADQLLSGGHKKGHH